MGAKGGSVILAADLFAGAGLQQHPGRVWIQEDVLYARPRNRERVGDLLLRQSVSAQPPDVVAPLLRLSLASDALVDSLNRGIGTAGLHSEIGTDKQQEPADLVHFSRAPVQLLPILRPSLTQRRNFAESEALVDR